MEEDKAPASEPSPGDETAPLSFEQMQAAASADESQRPMKEFAGYEIQDELGRGGMGVVYKAFDPRLKRTVALKVLLSAEHASEEEIQRFFREAESAASLQHPNIVPIHDLQVHEGKHYYTMDYIDGEPLDSLIKEKKLSSRQGLELLEKIARGLDHAHTQGIIHRDLKPANIIVGPDGDPKVTDFGLAKVLTTGEDAVTRAGLTGSGVAMGTPYYEAPEQAMGRSKDVDARTDVYALGCILYELVVGIPPFVAAGAMDILKMQIDDDPVPPSKRGAKVRADVETICLKCLEKEPERRYQTAGELADDIRRFLDGEPILARPSSITYRLRKKLLKNKKAVVASMVAVVLSLGVVIFGGHLLGYGPRASTPQSVITAETSAPHEDRLVIGIDIREVSVDKSGTRKVVGSHVVQQALERELQKRGASVIEKSRLPDCDVLITGEIVAEFTDSRVLFGRSKDFYKCFASVTMVRTHTNEKIAWDAKPLARTGLPWQHSQKSFVPPMVEALVRAFPQLAASDATKSTITVTYPEATTVWQEGQGKTHCEWRGASGGTVHVAIYRDGRYLGEYHGRTADDGHVDRDAALPEFMTAGTYRLKVWDAKGNYGWSPEFLVQGD